MFECFAVSCEIIGMNELAICFKAWNKILRRYAENRICLIRPPDGIGFQIPFPTSDQGKLLGFIQFFKDFRFYSLSFFQRNFRLLAFGDIFKGQQDPLRFFRRPGDAPGIQQQGASADDGKVVFHMVVIEDRLLGQDGFQQGAQGRDIPLPVSKIIDQAARSFPPPSP